MGERKPDWIAVCAGHATVGVAATWVTAKLVKAIGPSILIGLVAVVLHYQFDAPVSQVLSDLGI
jgi:hypothetical protein